MKYDDKINKSTLDNSPPPNYDKESKDECHHVNITTQDINGICYRAHKVKLWA